MNASDTEDVFPLEPEEDDEVDGVESSELLQPTDSEVMAIAANASTIFTRVIIQPLFVKA